MLVKYTLRVGKDEFELSVDVKNEKEMFEKLSFYSNLPRTAPGGSDDLKLVFRTTKKGHKYYSLISESEKMEFKLGQNLEANGGGLFPKGWEKAYQNEDEDATAQGAPAPAFGQQTAPVQQQQQQPQFNQPAPAPAFGMPQPQTVVAAPAAQPQAAPAQTPAPASANPAVQATANNVLARFGISNNR